MPDQEKKNYYDKVITVLAALSKSQTESPQGLVPEYVYEAAQANSQIFDFDYIMGQMMKSGNVGDFSDEQKIDFANTHRDMFDDLISLHERLSYFYDIINEKATRFQDANGKLVNIFARVLRRAHSCNMFFDVEENEAPLILNHEEFFCALSFLSDEQIRTVLSDQKPNVFNKLLTAYKAGESAFTQALGESDWQQSYKIRDLLMLEVEKELSQIDFIKDNPGLQSAYMTITINEDQVTANESQLEKYNKFLNPDEGPSLEELDDFLKPMSQLASLDRITHSTAYYLYNSEETSFFEKQDVKKIYEEWRNAYPDAPLLEDEPSVNNSNIRKSWMSTFIDKWIIAAIHHRMEQKSSSTNVEPEKSGTGTGKSDSVEITPQNSKRLSFPTRIQFNKIDAMLNNPILQGLYHRFGGYLENTLGEIITEEEFIYLFSGRISRPANYATPYYWNGEVNTFAGIVRLLYIGQEHGLDYVILPVKDKGKTKSSVKWSLRKQGLGKPTLKPIEDKIQAVVESVAGKRLKEVDLTKQNKPDPNKKDKKKEGKDEQTAV